MMAGFRGKWKLKRAQIYGLLLFRRQVIMWILCTKFLLIGKFGLFILESLQRFLLVENCIVSKWPLNYEWERKRKFFSNFDADLGGAFGCGLPWASLNWWAGGWRWKSGFQGVHFEEITPSLGKIDVGKVQLQLFGRHISLYVYPLLLNLVCYKFKCIHI